MDKSKIVISLVLICGLMVFSYGVWAAQPQVDANTTNLWHLDESSGVTAVNAVTGGTNGTLTNMAGTEWTTGRYGNGLTFDGVNDYVNVGNIGQWFSGWPEKATAEAWIKLDSVGSNYGIVGNTTARWYLAVRTTGKVEALFNDRGNNWTQGATVLEPGKWYHVAGTLSQPSVDNSEVIVYVNGVEDGSTPYAKADGIRLAAVLHGTNITIGSIAGENYFDGIIDEVRLSNIDRTEFPVPSEIEVLAEEIEALKARVSTLEETGGGLSEEEVQALIDDAIDEDNLEDASSSHVHDKGSGGRVTSPPIEPIEP